MTDRSDPAATGSASAISIEAAVRLAVFHAVLLAGLYLGGATGARAQSQPDGRWHGDINVGGSAATGNTRTTSVALRTDLQRVTDVDKIGIQAVINYNRSTTGGVRTQSADLSRGASRYDRNFGNRMFAFGGIDGEINRPAGLNSRRAVNVGSGWHLLRNDVGTWDVFTGIGHAETEFTDGSARSGTEFLIGQESQHKVGTATSLRQRVVLYTGDEKVGSRVTLDVGLSTAILGGWTMSTAYLLRFVEKQAPGSKKTDALLTFGFGYKF